MLFNPSFHFFTTFGCFFTLFLGIDGEDVPKMVHTFDTHGMNHSGFNGGEFHAV
jgi:hypothetical protein